MIKKIIVGFESFIEQVLSLNSAAILGSGDIGNVLLALNDDGSIKTNDKNEVEIIGAYPILFYLEGNVTTIH